MSWTWVLILLSGALSAFWLLWRSWNSDLEEANRIILEQKKKELTQIEEQIKLIREKVIEKELSYEEAKTLYESKYKKAKPPISDGDSGDPIN